MRVFLVLISVALYGNIAFLAWAILSLDRCGANDGCLGYVWNFWIGICLGILLCFLGGAAWAIAREKGIETRLVAFAVCLSAVTLIGLLSLTWMHKPS